ncbi:MAG: amino acid permease [Maricaulaceae bacterium]
MKTFYTPRTAMAVIVANMIGIGVFTSLGFQLETVQGGVPILMLWVMGGIMALCGAASYAELGASLPRSGGEYNFLGRIYHPIAGFVSGWISATIGFAAPIAAISMAFGAFTIKAVPGIPEGWEKPLAIGLVLFVTFFHGRKRKGSSRLQTSTTLLKIILVFLFCITALFFVPDPQPVRLLPVAGDLSTFISPAFGVALIYVSFSYTGWNAATYISGELEHPQRDLPKVLIFGTGFVMCMYVLLNFVFLKVAPVEALVGQKEIGYIAANAALGDLGGRLTAVMLALMLISTVSAMTLAGPRALQAIGEDFSALKLLSRTNDDGVPFVAIWLQSAIAIIFITTSSFKFIMVFAGSMLAFNSFVAVLGVFVLRFREPDLPRPYKTWAYPLTPLIFLIITGFALIYTIKENPTLAIFGFSIIIAGVIFYFVSKAFERKNIS